jgi:hypothetical protein
MLVRSDNQYYNCYCQLSSTNAAAVITAVTVITLHSARTHLGTLAITARHVQLVLLTLTTVKPRAAMQLSMSSLAVSAVPGLSMASVRVTCVAAGNQKASSRTALAVLSLPCAALRVPSVPNAALSEVGAAVRALLDWCSSDTLCMCFEYNGVYVSEL